MTDTPNPIGIAMTPNGAMLLRYANPRSPYYIPTETSLVGLPDIDADPVSEILTPCATFFVSSLPGGVAESGSGTRDDPWVNLNTVFKDSRVRCLISVRCAPPVNVVINGVVDYAINGTNYNFSGKLVLCFEVPYTYSYNPTSSYWSRDSFIRQCKGVVFRNFTADMATESIGLNRTVECALFNDCGSCVLYLSNIRFRLSNATPPNSMYRAAAILYGFYTCNNMRFVSSSINLVTESTIDQQREVNEASLGCISAAICDSTNVVVLDSDIRVSGSAFFSDIGTRDESTYPAVVVQSFGIARGSTPLVRNTSIICEKRIVSGRYGNAYAVCAIGPVATILNCTFSPSEIKKLGNPSLGSLPWDCNTP